METLLLNGAAVNSKDKKWLTPLHRACCSGNYNVVDILLRYKADANARDRSWQTPLHVAAANNAVQCVELILPYLLSRNITDRFVHISYFITRYHKITVILHNSRLQMNYLIINVTSS